MAQPIEFYFDFSSPYGYFAAHGIDALAARHGRETVWRPFLLGAVFKLTGSGPLVDLPMKGDYARRDLPRTARMAGVPFTLPDPFPFLALAPSRAFYWLEARDPAAAKDLALACYQAAFGEGRNLSEAETVLDVAEARGHDRADLAEAIADPAVKARLKEETDTAIHRGVFGSPFVIVDDEPFWGHDRLAMLDWWLGGGR
ncbi:MAG: 2-hydroxychromene-2-carboxylate isomerase [Alphaproteobacteria bacterium]|jgi:2-hydroxychromene-2-carboxylate isomerase|nr:2-hydroxychromene-2-carboxylate isomerase [Alphaproteobacteria bacterium]